jgi:hypothetical protein
VILDVDLANAAAALDEAQHLHARGESFTARIPSTHPRTLFAVRNAAGLLVRGMDYDDRRRLLDELADHAGEALDPTVASTLRKIVRLADGVAVRTWCDCHQLEFALGVPVEPRFEEVHPDVPIPQVARDGDADAVVVWAPTYAAERVALVAFALEELRRPVFVVCKEGRIAGLRAEFLPYERAKAALRRAAVFVDATIEHPGNVVAAARLGIPLAVSVGVGAHEFLDGIAVYFPWSRADVLRSVQIALGLEAPRVRAHPLGGLCEATAVDPNDARSTLAQAVERRRRGERFAALLAPPERDAAGPRELAAMRDVGDLAERVVARSWLDAFRLVGALGQYPTNLTVAACPDPGVPLPGAREPDGSIVVWAPRAAFEQVRDIASALEGWERAVHFVCRDGKTAAEDALRRASVVVDADPDDPGPALALARWGIPLCVAATSGANEYLESVERYPPGHRRGIAEAVRRAAAGTPPRLRASRAVASLETRVTGGQPGRPALVSLIVCGAEAMREPQTYPSIETIRTGRDVKEINRALKASHGVYVAVVDERDILLPDHVERLVAALEPSQCSVAASTTFVAFADGQYLGTDRKALECTRLLACDQFVDGGLRILMRRSVLERAGWLVESIGTGWRYELWLRLSRTEDFVCVDRITTIFVQPGTRTVAADFQAQRTIYALHPASGRRAIEEERRAILDRLMHGQVPILVPTR